MFDTDFIDIQPDKKGNMNCHEESIATIASWWNRDHIMQFVRSWGFHYDRTTKHRIYHNKKNAYDYIDIFHGVKIREHYSEHVENLLKVIEVEIHQKKKPVAIYIDSYDCPWNPAFKKFHIDHYCIVIGMNSGDSSYLYCIDPYISEKVYELNVEDYAKGNRECLTFERVTPNPDEKLLDKILEDTKNNTVNENTVSMFEHMRTFADEINELLSLDDVMVDGSVNIQNTAIFFMFTEVIWARICLAQMFDYLSQTFDNKSLVKVSNKFRLASEQWSQIKNVLITVNLSVKNASKKLERASGYVKTVAEFEEELFATIANRTF